MGNIDYLTRGYDIVADDGTYLTYRRKRIDRFSLKEYIKWIFCTCGLGLILYPLSFIPKDEVKDIGR